MCPLQAARTILHVGWLLTARCLSARCSKINFDIRILWYNHGQTVTIFWFDQFDISVFEFWLWLLRRLILVCKIYLPDVYKQVITSILTEICTMPRSDRQGFFHAPMMPSLKAAEIFSSHENFGNWWYHRAKIFLRFFDKKWFIILPHFHCHEFVYIS